MKQTIKYDLQALLTALVEREDGISALYLFGSRAYGTGSLRSDCDILVRAAPNKLVKASSLLGFSTEKCPALDLFLCTDARAVSVSNDSFVYASSFDALVEKLDAIKLWDRECGFANFTFPVSRNWDFEVSCDVEFVPTVLPDAHISELSWQHKIKMVEALGLPVQPFIGDTLKKAVAQIIDVTRRMIFRSDMLGPRGHARQGWTVNLRSEYDCQNLFFTIVKPWLPELAREEVAIIFDDQSKLSDFSLFEGRLIIEMKFIDDNAKKAEVVKTLDGLSRFYSRNANIGWLLFILFVKRDVQIDSAKWESDYSFITNSPPVTTVVISI